VECCRATCSKCRFSPLFGSLLKFSSGHFSRPRICFPLRISLFPLCRARFAISRLFCLGFSFLWNHLCSVRLCGETAGRFLRSGPERRARDKTEAAPTGPKSTKAWKVGRKDDMRMLPVSDLSMSFAPASFSGLQPLFPHLRLDMAAT
jgi:hypothetical protein